MLPIALNAHHPPPPIALASLHSTHCLTSAQVFVVPGHAQGLFPQDVDRLVTKVIPIAQLHRDFLERVAHVLHLRCPLLSTGDPTPRERGSLPPSCTRARIPPRLPRQVAPSLTLHNTALQVHPRVDRRSDVLGRLRLSGMDTRHTLRCVLCSVPHTRLTLQIPMLKGLYSDFIVSYPALCEKLKAAMQKKKLRKFTEACVAPHSSPAGTPHVEQTPARPELAAHHARPATPGIATPRCLCTHALRCATARRMSAIAELAGVASTCRVPLESTPFTPFTLFTPFTPFTPSTSNSLVAIHGAFSAMFCS